MNYDHIFTLGSLILIPIFIIIISSFFYLLYKLTSEPSLINQHKLALIEIKKIFESHAIDKKSAINVFFIITLSVMLSNLLIFPLLTLEYDILIFLFILISPFLFSGLYYDSRKVYYSSRKYFSLLMRNTTPLFISIFSIIIQYIYVYGNSEVSITINSLIQFQNVNVITIDFIYLPAYFLFLNPFAFLSFTIGLIGIFRMYKSNPFNNNQINRNIFSKVLRNLSMLTYVLFLLCFFLGGASLIGGKTSFLDFMIILLFILSIILIIGIIDHGKPELLIEKKLFGYFNTPIILSLFSLLYSIVLIYL